MACFEEGEGEGEGDLGKRCDAKAERCLAVIFTRCGLISFGGRSQKDPDAVYLWPILLS